MLLEMGRCLEAVCALHEALAVGPQDPVATDLLSRALEENASEQGWGGQAGGAGVGVGNSFAEDVEEEADALVRRRMEDGWGKRGRRRRGRGENGVEGLGGMGEGRGVGEDSGMVMSDEE